MLDYVDPTIGIPVAIGLWVIYISLVIKDKRQERALNEELRKEEIQ